MLFAVSAALWGLWPGPLVRVRVALQEVAAGHPTIWLQSPELGTVRLDSNPAQFRLRPWQRTPSTVDVVIRRPGFITRHLRAQAVTPAAGGELSVVAAEAIPPRRRAPSRSAAQPASTPLAVALPRTEFALLVQSTRTQINRMPLPELRKRHELLRTWAAQFKAAGDAEARTQATNWATLLEDMIAHRERHQHVRLLAPEDNPGAPSLLGAPPDGAEPEREDEMPLI